MTTTWNLKDTKAQANLDGWVAEICPTQPATGLQLHKNEITPWKVLTVRAMPSHSLTPEEVYVRQNDLIVRFDQGPEDRFAFQLNWRLLPTAPLDSAGVELWVSVQTDDLDSEPALQIQCESPGGAYWEIYQHPQLAGTDGQKIAYLERGAAALVTRSNDATGVWLIEPTDQSNVVLLSSPSDGEQRLELFGHFMEKGVIRRARMRFYAIEGELTLEQIQTLYQSFANSPLPLTA